MNMFPNNASSLFLCHYSGVPSAECVSSGVRTLGHAAPCFLPWGGAQILRGSGPLIECFLQ